MTRKRIIADEHTARLVGTAHCNGRVVKEMNIFSYPHKSSGLTLFGVELVTTDANGNRQTETIVTQ